MKALLLIDDGNEHVGVLDNIAAHLKRYEQINIDTFYINPLDRLYYNEEKDPDLENIVSDVKNKLSTYKVGLIVIDQYYSDFSGFDGIKLISKLRSLPKFKNCPIFLISGKRDKIVRDIFSDTKSTESDKVNELSRIIGYGITRFLDKTFRDEAIEVLKIRTVNEILPGKLREYEDQNFKIDIFSPKYADLTLQDLADQIDDNTKDSKFILEEIFELTLSHYAKINATL